MHVLGTLDCNRYERTEAERFWEKVDKSGDCWLWTAYVNTSGYGVFGLSDRKLILAHRYAYQTLVGPIARGLTIDHLCRQSLCVNPSHVELVPSSVNVQRGKALITHCPSGHPYDEANTYLHQGRRHCKTCQRGGRTHPKWLRRNT